MQRRGWFRMRRRRHVAIGAVVVMERMPVAAVMVMMLGRVTVLVEKVADVIVAVIAISPRVVDVDVSP